MSDEAVYRTAPATPGLLNSEHKKSYQWYDIMTKSRTENHTTFRYAQSLEIFDKNLDNSQSADKSVETVLKCRTLVFGPL